MGYPENEAPDPAASHGPDSVAPTEPAAGPGALEAPQEGASAPGSRLQARRSWRASARPLIARLALPIFLLEAGVMGLITLFGPMPVITETIFDASLLTLFLFPALYLLTFRPLRAEIEQRKRLEETLQAAKASLEGRVTERTLALREASTRLGAEIEESRRLYRSLFDNQLVGVYLADLEGHLIDCNTAFASIHGYPSREALLADPGSAAPGESLPWQPPLDSLPPDGTPALLERGSSHGEGRSHWLLESAALVPDGSGSLTRIEGAQLDISDRRRAEHEREALLHRLEEERNTVQELAGALEEDRDLLRVIMGNTRARLAYLDPAFNVVLANAAYASACGRSPEELPGSNHFDLFPYTSSRAAGDGRSYWDWTLTPVTGRDAQLSGLVLSMVDVTDLTLAQQSLSRAHVELEERVRERTADLALANEALEAQLAERRRAESLARTREQMFRSLAENLPDLISRFGRDLRLLYLSRDIEAATGLPHEGSLGRTLAELDLPAPMKSQLDEGIRRALDTGEVGAVEFSFAPEGEPRWYEARIVPEHGPDGRVETALLIARDISKRLKDEHALRRFAEEQRALYTVAAAASNLQETDELLSALLDAVITVTGADAGWVTVVPGTPGRPPRVAASRGVDAGFIAAACELL